LIYSALPWDKIVKALPVVVKLTSDLLRNTKEDQSAKNIEERVHLLEENLTTQAELNKRIAEQLAASAAAMEQLRKSNQALRWIALFSLALAFVALVIALVAWL
jgi:septal ring factor EnvC (AmiA/AmiB activator)